MVVERSAEQLVLRNSNLMNIFPHSSWEKGWCFPAMSCDEGDGICANHTFLTKDSPKETSCDTNESIEVNLLMTSAIIIVPL